VPQEVFEKLQPYFDANRTCIGTIFAQGGGNRIVIGRKVFESLAFHGFSMKRGCFGFVWDFLSDKNSFRFFASNS
jgi:hypothetical protein